MKTLLLSAFLCLVAFGSFADEPTGVKFFTGSWKDVLAEAKRQNKPIFIDIYTTWCGPCKMMDKQAFPDARVGEKFNANFVSYKIDAEKGEGIELARRFKVAGYPTSLFVSADGNLIYRTLGYGGIDGLLKEADKAITAAKDPKPLSVWEKEYESGKRDPEFLFGYLEKRAKLGMPSNEVLDAYLKQLPEAELKSEKNLELMAESISSTKSLAFPILMQELPRFQTTAVGRDALMNLQTALRNDLKAAVANKSEAELEQVISHNRKLMGFFRPVTEEAAEATANEYRMNYYQQTKDTEKYRSVASAYAEKFLMSRNPETLRQKDAESYKNWEAATTSMPDSLKKGEQYEQTKAYMKSQESSQVAGKLNNIAWAYFLSVTNPKDLNQALGWSKRSLELDNSSMYMDTYAHLLLKLGKKAEALNVQQEAIAKDKALGKDTKDLEAALAEMKK